MPALLNILPRRGTAAAWTSANPVLLSGEIGYETDTDRIKIGDGATAWTSLDYWASEVGDHLHDAAAIVTGTLADGRVAESNVTQHGAAILTDLKTRDGAGSGLDADLLDGQHGSHYLDLANSTGTLATARFANNTVPVAALAHIAGPHVLGRSAGTSGAAYGLTMPTLRTMLNIEDGATADQSAAEILTAIKTVDGSGSGLDADLLDGQQGSFYRDASNLNAGTLAAARLSSTARVYTIDPALPKSNVPQSTLSTPSLAELAISPAYISNKLQFGRPASLEYTTDGTTWLPHALPPDSNTVRDLFLGRYTSAVLPIYGPSNGNWAGLRMTFDASVWPGKYVYLDALYLYQSTRGHSCSVTIERSYGADDTTWSTVATGPFSGWPGHTMVPHSAIPWHHTPTPGTHSRYVRITFTPTWNPAYPTNNIECYQIDWWGTYPASSLGGELFSWDRDKKITLPGALHITGDLTLTGTVDGRDLAADGAKLDGVESGATADMSAAEILTAIKTVDGSGSGLDADMLDGRQASGFTYHERAISDLDAITHSAYDVRTFSSGFQPANRPAVAGSNYAVGLQLGYADVNFRAQIAFASHNEPRLFVRTEKTAGAPDDWTTWYEVWHAGNLASLITELDGQDEWVDTNEIADQAVTLQKLQNIATARVLGRVSAGSGQAEELTAPQVRALVRDVYTLTPPAGYPATPHILPMRTPLGWRGHVGARSLKPTIAGTTYYVDQQTGSNANAGTAGAPFQSIWYALQRADVGRVLVAPGVYRRNHYFSTPTFAIGADAAYSVERWPMAGRSGPVISCPAEESITWAVNGTYSKVYQATLAGIDVVNVVDIGVTLDDGSPARYQRAGSLAQCAAAPGSYWFDTSPDTLYVRPFNSGTPGDELLVMRGFNGAVDTATRRDAYFDGITFIGGAAGLTLVNSTGTAGGSVIATNCRFLSSQTGGAQIQGIQVAIFEDCKFNANAGDGLSIAIHASGALTTTNGVAVNCEGLNNGDASLPDTVNGFTTHENAAMAFINCQGRQNVGPNFAFVDDENHTWLVGCESGPSAGIADSPINKNAGFLFYTGSSGWMHECVSTAALTDAVVDGSSELNVDRCAFSTTSGTLTPYTQT